MPRALLSVTNKLGLGEFARGLASIGFELISTGGTAEALRAEGLRVTEVHEVTGFPEMLDGRVKTLHPAIHGGLLADVRQPSHAAQIAQARILPFELACVNLYDFEGAARAGAEAAELTDAIDIGGPAMIRAAAKNHANVLVVVDPSDYGRVLCAIQEGCSDAMRLALAAKAFRHTATYDSVVARRLTSLAGEETFPESLLTGYRKRLDLRYGENPHQRGALYADPLAAGGVANATQLWGKELGYNNVLDADSAWRLVSDMPATSCAIIKHGNPCGAAVAESFAEAFELARRSDPVSAFGGIAAVNGWLDEEAARAMAQKGNFLEVVLATGFDEAAIEVFQSREGWGKNVRLLAVEAGTSRAPQIRSVEGGALAQDPPCDLDGPWRIVTKAQPSEKLLDAMRLQWTIVRHVKSNAIAVGTCSRLLGVGAGQSNRVGSVRLALQQAGSEARGAALASDAFFPFADGVREAGRAGISAIVQPGGSKKDEEVIGAADEFGIAMAFTGERHFLH